MIEEFHFFLLVCFRLIDCCKKKIAYRISRSFEVCKQDFVYSFQVVLPSLPPSIMLRGE